MKKKKKAFFKTFISSLLCCLFVVTCFFVTGCDLIGGDWESDLQEKLNNGEITQEEYDKQVQEHRGNIFLDSVKVLRKTNFDFSSNEIYKEFATKILEGLDNVFGTCEEPGSITSKIEGKEKEIFFIDSMRYIVKNINGKEITIADNNWNWAIPTTKKELFVKAKQNEVSVNIYTISEDYTLENLKNYYTDEYKNLFVNEDYINTLSYAIYSIMLEKEIANSKYEGDNWVIEGFESTDDAYSQLKTEYESKAIYLGLTEADINSLNDYIMKSVIGSTVEKTIQGVSIKDLVGDIINWACKKIEIGKTADGKSVYINQPIPLSEVIDYNDTDFYAASGEDEFELINSSEYQSLFFQPKEDIKITDLWLDFYYVAKDEDGIQIKDNNATLDVSVTINWWTGSELLQMEQTIKLKSGYYEAFEENTTLEFELDSSDFGAFGCPITIDYVDCTEANLDNITERQDIKSKNNVASVFAENDLKKIYTVDADKHISNNSGKLNINYLATKYSGKSFFEITFDTKSNLSKNTDFCVVMSTFADYSQDLSWVK